MAALLDSDIVILRLADDPDITQVVDQLLPSGLFMSAVSYMEVLNGIGRGPDPAADAAALQSLHSRVLVLPFGIAEAQRCAQVRESLQIQGRRVPSRELELLVAATAIEHNLILVTRNVRDYRSIPGIQLYGPI